MIIVCFIIAWFFTLATAFYIGRFSVWFEVGWHLGKLSHERNIPVAEAVKAFRKEVLEHGRH